MPRLPRPALLGLALLLAPPASAAAQGPTHTVTVDGPGSQWVDGVLRCSVGEEAQFSIRGFDAEGNLSVLEQTLPVARSSNPRVVAAVVPDYSAYILNLVCRGDGQARVQVTAGRATTSFFAMVGTARDAEPARVASVEPRTAAATGIRPQAVEIRVSAGALQAQGVTPPLVEIRVGTAPIAAQGSAPAAIEVRVAAPPVQVVGQP